YRKNGRVLVDILDNGAGMEEKRIKEILSLESSDVDKKHVTGIGMRNIIQRLLVFYELSRVEDVIEIESEIGKGTRVTLKIPYKKGEDSYGEAVNS
ncbi:MAG: sensor histidine kinase, partial [Caldanaerobacter sp.]